MSDIPDCRKCGTQLDLEPGCQYWTCPNEECENYRKRVIPTSDDIDWTELRFGESR